MTATISVAPATPGFLSYLSGVNAKIGGALFAKIGVTSPFATVAATVAIIALAILGLALVAKRIWNSEKVVTWRENVSFQNLLGRKVDGGSYTVVNPTGVESVG